MIQTQKYRILNLKARYFKIALIKFYYRIAPSFTKTDCKDFIAISRGVILLMAASAAAVPAAWPVTMQQGIILRELCASFIEDMLRPATSKLFIF